MVTELKNGNENMIQKNWQELIKPNKVESYTHDNPNITSVIAEPLERDLV